MELRAGELAEALARGEALAAPPPDAARRTFVIGDPQAPPARVFAVLAKYGLLADDGWLARDIQLVSMGDHFDFEGSGASDGLAVLSWFAAHAPAQVTILLGNHDAARVMEFSDAPDDLPAQALVERDYASFAVPQRALVERLLRARRFALAATAARDGRPLLLTHAGVTAREVALLGVDARPEPLARALAGALERASARGLSPLDLAPLHVAGAKRREDPATPEGGGLLYHRPADPAHSKTAADFDLARPRRFDPRTLPRGLAQVVGHSGDARNRRMMPAWLAPDLPPYASVRTLVVGDGDNLVYRAGVTLVVPTPLVLVDPELAHHDAADIVLLALDAGSVATYGRSTSRTEASSP